MGIDLRRSLGRVPGVRLVRNYHRDLLRGDVVAGIAVTALMVPHGMAYAQLAGVPAVTGLYTTVTALLAYALFGPSRRLLLGPDSSLAPLIAAALALVISDGDPATAIAAAGVLALMTGALCVLAGLSRLGSIAELLSRPVELGYLNGLAVVMIVSQLAKLAGFSTTATSPYRQLGEFVDGIADGLVEPVTLALGLAVLGVVLLLSRFMPAVPGVLIAVAGSILAVWAFGLDEDGVAVVGALPSGFPTPRWPSIGAGSLPPLFLASIGLAWVTLSDTTALSRGFANRTGERVDPNREIMALGASNLAAGAFQGFPVSASTSRTTIAFASGGNTQLVGVISAGLVLVLLLGASGVIALLPTTALAAIVIAAALALFDLDTVRWLYHARRSEFWLALAATVGVVTLGVLYGILVAVVLSLVNFVRKVWRPYDAVLGRIDQRMGYHDVSRHPEATTIPGLVLFRFDAPLFFANADHFERRVNEVLRRSPTQVRRFVVAAEPITDIDTSAAAMLERLIPDLHSRGIEFGFAELKGPVKDRLRQYGLYDVIGVERYYSSVGAAADRYVIDHGIDYVDWTER